MPTNEQSIAPTTDPVPDPYRLPTTVRPIRYDVRLRPSLADATFIGNVTIDVQVDTATDTIVLNAIELDIAACAVDGRPATFTLDEATERLTITTPTALDGPTATISIEFAGILNDKLRGFYRSTYLDDDGNEQVIATTQMQATDCRRAFPCWDEPEYKAIFGITLDVEEGLTAISNGPEVERATADGRSVIRFADTMVMSSYLVAFVVGHLEVTDPIDVDGTPMRIVHVPGKGHLTGFGLEIGEFALRWFQDYYGIAYPSDKIDLLAVPDFAAGAMENLGCITFRESLLLLDPQTSTQDEQQRVADVVAHELAHMWFGDLVTMRWWNGIWLNEAFATFMEIAACDAFRPAWQRWTSFGLERSAAFEVDSLASTRPVEFEVRSPADCEGMFDVLTYQKGGALLRMLEQFLSPEEFQRGVTHYLRTHAYANTETNDLWDALESTSGQPVRRMMDSWIWQPGYPLVSASVVDGAEGRPALCLTQSRFSFGRAIDRNDSGGVTDDDTVWVVPVQIRNGAQESTVLLDGRSPTIVPLADPDAAVVVNAGGHGYFRVAYDAALRSRLTGAVLDELDTLERYNLVDDAWSATLAGELSAVDLLELLTGFADEGDHAVWQAITASLGGLSRLVDGDALEAFRRRVRELVGPALSRLGEPVAGEADLAGKLRGLLTSTVGVLGRDPAAIARSREWFAAASKDPRSVHPELLAAATSVVAATGGLDDYEAMLRGFTTGSTPQEQLRHLHALPLFDSEELVLRTCDFALSSEVKTQNAPFVLQRAMANRQHGAAAWAFVRDHWSDATERFPSNTIVRMIDSVKLLTSPALVDEIQTFFAAHPIEQALATQRQILERQRVNAALLAREGSALTDHLT